MTNRTLSRRAPAYALLSAAISLGLYGCSDNDIDISENDINPPTANYAASIQRTEFGIPHILSLIHI